MIVLGIHDGHDSGACLLKDGKIVAAVNEERLIREKLCVRMPVNSIREVLDIANVEPGDVDRVAIARILGTMATLGWTDINIQKRLYQFLCNRLGFFASTMSFANLQRSIFKPFRNKDTEKFIRSIGVDAEVEYLDHHLCHAASAYYTSGKERCLVITSDGSGDGLCGSVYVGDDGELNLLKQIPTFHSIAYYYAYVTLLAGFKMFRHEGKITGLAAYCDPAKSYGIFKEAIGYNGKYPVNKLGLMGTAAMDRLRDRFKNFEMCDVAAGIQKRFEDVMEEYFRNWADETGIPDVAVAGGAFANVKLNQRISELPNVNSFYVHPHMGDGGLAVGAALYVSAIEALNKGRKFEPYELNNVYFGREFSNDEIEDALNKNGLKGEFVDDIEAFVAEKVAEKKVVGYFDGRMEYGPRALGNRSILADPTDPNINDWLNEKLRRTEFMPFAPTILDSVAEDYYKGYEKGRYPARFMTITFNVKEEAKKAPAVVHVDGTTRPQVLSREQNSRYYEILKKYEQETGLPLFVNTSFNMHEEPIVCTPNDAIRAFIDGSLDVLVMKNWGVVGDNP